ncbi:AAA family ATPase [Arcobacter cryaerophilus gv. pseudocryaerophilus]
MNEYFIQKIGIKDCRHIKDLEILLSETERKHLIFTGKNGSGKTTTLKEINILLNKLIKNGFATVEQSKQDIENYQNAIKSKETNIENIKLQIDEQKELFANEIDSQKKAQIDNNIKSYEANILNHKSNINIWKKNILNCEQLINSFSKVNLLFSNSTEIYENIVQGKFILAFFEAKRENAPIVPDSIRNIDISTINQTDTKNIHKQFISYMVRLRNTLLNEEYDGDKQKAKSIKGWFDNFENTLKNLFQKDDLKLKYYNDELNFKITYDDKEFGLNELSDGYSSLLSIVTELILRMEAHNVSTYDMQGVVLVDEIETHLHVDLQKKVLPFLISFFPKIQFIVTTHSPFVLSSLSNVVICDLENNIITEDLSSYSYEALVDTYFNVNKYSEELKLKVERFKILVEKKNNKNISEDELIEYNKLGIFFEQVPYYKNEELGYILNQIKSLNLGN